MKLSWPTIGFFLLVHVLGAYALLPQFWSWGNFFMYIFLCYLTGCLGLTVGYHRLFAHRAFETTTWIRRILATCGSLSAEYGPITWPGIHRQHHMYTDTDLDPHNSRKGFWWSHIGWMLVEVPAEKNVHRLTPDLRKDGYFRWLDKYFILLQIPLGVILYSIGGWSMVLWGIPLRIISVYHMTWFINSAAHMWGYRSYETNDCSTNNTLLGLIAFGEGWHNDHHKFPDSARVGLNGEFDLTWQHVVFLKKLGLARNIRLPNKYK